MTQTKIPPLFTPGQRLDAVVTIETSQGRKHHHRLGAAFVNTNGTIGVVLNSLPFDRSFRLLPTTSAQQGLPDSTDSRTDAPPDEASARAHPTDNPTSSSTTSQRRPFPAPHNEQ